jgi:SAM-dependent methyltransferase
VGTLLCDLSAAGFRSLLGVDPLIPHDIRYAPGLQIRKAYLDELSGEWDVIMLHHTLEHISEQLQTLRDVASRLAPDGTCLIRIPTVSSWAWQHYREHWAQVDAPRHLFVHSVESITKIAGDAGLRLDAVVYDSTDWQFAASELYLSGRPLSALAKAYSPAELRRFRARARLLNAQGQGDQAAFYFSRSN